MVSGAPEVPARAAATRVRQELQRELSGAAAGDPALRSAGMLAAVDEPDPARRERKVLHCYVDRLLGETFTGLPRSTPQFADIVDRVTDAMLGEPSLAPLIREVCERLVRSAKDG